MLSGVGADETVVERIVLETVRATVAEVNPTCHTNPRLDTALERDLGLDSLVRAELLLRLETALDVRLPDRVVSTAETPRDLVAEALRAEPAAFAAPSVSSVLRGTKAEMPESIRTLVDALEWHASVHPERVHVRVLGDDPETAAVEVTYGRLRVRACAIAAGLAASDVRPGDTVALMLPTSVDYFAVFFGVLFAGAVPVPLYPPMRAAQLDDYLRRQIGILDNARAVALVTSSDAERVARALRAPLGSRCRVTTVAELERERSGEVRPPVRADDVALLQYTSGSTGSPKGVVLTHADLLANIRAMARAARADASDLFVSWLPLYHDMGLIGAWLGSLCVGFPLVLMSPVSFLVRPARWLRAVGTYHATLSASPNFGFDLCARRLRDDELAGIELSSLRMVFNGAEPVSADTLDRFLERFAPYGLRPEAIAPVYGLAEAAVGLAFPPPGRPPLVDEIARDSLARTGRAEPVGADALDRMRVVACGRPLPGYEIRVVDRAGHVLGARHEGRVEFRGPSATQGYYRNPEETRRLFDGEWLDTGDLGYMADGDIFLTGRAKDLIIRAGRNLHPEELENAVGAMPGVRRGCVAVFAMPEPESGTERLVVAAETHVHDPSARDQLRAAIVNVTVDVLGTPADDVLLLEPRTVPKTSSGKVRRAACRDLHREGKLTLSTAPPAARARSADGAVVGATRRRRPPLRRRPRVRSLRLVGHDRVRRPGGAGAVHRPPPELAACGRAAWSRAPRASHAHPGDGLRA